MAAPYWGQPRTPGPQRGCPSLPPARPPPTRGARADALAMQRRATGLKKGAAAAAAMELTPGAAAGMAIRADVAETGPAAIAAIGVGTEMVRGVDLTVAPPDEDELGWRGAGRLSAQVAVLLTGVTGWLTGESLQRLWALRAFSGWRDRLRCGQASRSVRRSPQPMEHPEEPHQRAQRQRIENMVRYHGVAPSNRS